VNNDNPHRAVVHAWIERAARGLPPQQAFRAFERAFNALWLRAHRTLGDVTLMAIADRVLHNAAEQFSMLGALKVEASGLRGEALHTHADSVDTAQLVEGLRFVLVEFLTVLGNLTADILTPALHAELAKLPARPAPQTDTTPNDPPTGGFDEEAKS
jgi:hypothetical protein